MKNKSFILAVAVMANCGLLSAQTVTLQLDRAQTKVSPTHYGLMTEEINYAYEGGLYAQLIRNGSFKDIVGNGRNRGGQRGFRAPMPQYWSITDTINATLSIDNRDGINRANPSSACIEVKGKGIGLVNDGFWGFPVRASEQMKGAFFAKRDASASSDGVTVSLESLDGSVVYASAHVSGIAAGWKKYEFALTMPEKVTPTKDARFRITPDGQGKYWFTRVTLFPETFNDRNNGLRKDLMTMMKDMHPKFLRFPGGNYLEGNDFRNRFDWKSTIGDPDLRPGHQSPWGYRSSDGLGLLEFLTWAEDVGAEPVVGVFAGYVLSGDYVGADYVGGFVQDALDEIEYITGGADTKWGAQRIKDGHPEPFPLHYIEVGNEDFFDRSGSYPGRFMAFYNAIKAKYPQLQIISTLDAKALERQALENGVKGLKYDVIDEHYYRGAIDMYRNAFQYDSYDRNGPKIFCGEWATREGEPTPNMNAALGDAAWMTCMERNSDIVVMHCYAPLFVNVNPGGMQWTSDLIGYDALNAYGSPSYYAQVMFAGNLGDRIVPLVTSDIPEFQNPGRDGKNESLRQMYFSATRDSKYVYLKVANVREQENTVSVNLEGVGKVVSKAEKTELKASGPLETNSIDNPHHIVPIKSRMKVGRQFSLKMAPYSIVVLKIEVK